MIYELRTYTLVPGKQAEYLKLSGDVGRKARGDKYGKLEGHWFTEFGTLNQVVHLWSYPDLNERERLRGELAKNEEWTKGYLPQIRSMLAAQENKILSAQLPLKPPASGGQGRGVAGPLQGHHAGPREVLEERGPLADGDGSAQRGGAPLGLPRSQRPCRRPRQGDAGPGVAGLPGQGDADPLRDEVHHPQPVASLADEVIRSPRGEGRA